MHDVIVLYSHPQSPEDFDEHYRKTHVPLVHQLPDLREFTWGKTTEANAPYYLVARLTYASSSAGAQSLASAKGQESVKDLANFADAGVIVLNVTRHG